MSFVAASQPRGKRRIHLYLDGSQVCGKYRDIYYGGIFGKCNRRIRGSRGRRCIPCDLDAWIVQLFDSTRERGGNAVESVNNAVIGTSLRRSTGTDVQPDARAIEITHAPLFAIISLSNEEYFIYGVVDQSYRFNGVSSLRPCCKFAGVNFIIGVAPSFTSPVSISPP